MGGNRRFRGMKRPASISNSRGYSRLPVMEGNSKYLDGAETSRPSIFWSVLFSVLCIAVLVLSTIMVVKFSVQFSSPTDKDSGESYTSSNFVSKMWYWPTSVILRMIEPVLRCIRLNCNFSVVKPNLTWMLVYWLLGIGCAKCKQHHLRASWTGVGFPRHLSISMHSFTVRPVHALTASPTVNILLEPNWWTCSVAHMRLRSILISNISSLTPRRHVLNFQAQGQT